MDMTQETTEFDKKVNNAINAIMTVHSLEIALARAKNAKDYAIRMVMNDPSVTERSYTDPVSEVRFECHVKADIPLKDYARIAPEDFESMRDDAVDEFHATFKPTQSMFHDMARSKGMTTEQYALSLGLEMRTKVEYKSVVPSEFWDE